MRGFLDIQLNSIKTAIGGLTSLKDVDKHIRTTLSKLIEEINHSTTTVSALAEVTKVLTTVADLPLDVDDQPRYELIGSIYFQQINGKGKPYRIGESQGVTAKPLNPNIKQLPVEGEYVMVKKIFGQYFYTSRVNVFNNPNNASYQGFSKQFQTDESNTKRNKTLQTADTGISKDKQSRENRKLGETFETNFNFRQVVTDEGDLTLNGRFGNSIKLGSNTKNEIADSPNIKLRAGQLQDVTKFGEEDILEQLSNAPFTAPVAENINSDGSSLWMTTDETVSITPATLEDTNIYPTEVAPAEFGGKQIILNSGRLIFNSKEDGILGFSNGPVDFSTLNTFGVSAKQGLNLYSPTISIGRDTKTKNLSLESNEVVINATDGYITNIANKIELFGSGLRDASPAVRGTELRELLEVIIDVLGATTQAVQQIGSILSTAGAPTPNPALAKITTDMLETFSKRIEAKLNIPTLLSQVVEIE